MLSGTSYSAATPQYIYVCKSRCKHLNHGSCSLDEFNKNPLTDMDTFINNYQKVKSGDAGAKKWCSPSQLALIFYTHLKNPDKM